MDEEAKKIEDLFNAEERERILKMESKVLAVGECFRGVLQCYKKSEDHTGRVVDLVVFKTKKEMVNMAMSTDLKQKLIGAVSGDTIGIQRIDDVISQGSGQHVKQYMVVKMARKGK